MCVFTDFSEDFRALLSHSSGNLWDLGTFRRLPIGKWAFPLKKVVFSGNFRLFQKSGWGLGARFPKIRNFPEEKSAFSQTFQRISEHFCRIPLGISEISVLFRGYLSENDLHPRKRSFLLLFWESGWHLGAPFQRKTRFPEEDCAFSQTFQRISEQFWDLPLGSMIFW